MNQSQTREAFATNEGVTLCQDVGADLQVPCGNPQVGCDNAGDGELKTRGGDTEMRILWKL